MPNLDPEQWLDEVQQQHTEIVREQLRIAGRPDLIDELDRNLKDVRTGVAGARATWAALSLAQKRALAIAGEGNRKFYRAPGSRMWMNAYGEPEAVDKAATIKGMEALVRRGLMDWHANATTVSNFAAITERGKFVLKNGERHA